MENRRSDMARVWALQTAVLALVALVVFWGFYVIDHFAAAPGSSAVSVLGRYFSFDPAAVSNGVSALCGINVAVLGIVITVVSIIVQLTAERYSGVARMFLSDRVNLLVPAYYVVACVAGVWVATAVKNDFVPRSTLTVVLSMTMGGLVIMAPYFSYVFWFLEPGHIIDRIREQAVERATSGALKRDEANCYAAQAQTLFAIEELTDITNNSISGRDKIIASGAVDALRDLALEYLKVKRHASSAWFSIGPQIKLNPDFVAMDPESLLDLEERRTWVEWKVMRQYLSIYNEALGSMRDINYLIAIDTRYVGEAAARAGDTELIELVYRYFNSYLRATINAKEVRTAYNVLHQYRKLVEAMLEIGNHKAAAEGVKHIKYYGIVSFDMNLSFITETAAFDLSTLAQLASELKSPVEHDILAQFLELDRPPHMRGQQKALLGVRKAQVKLAAYYLAVGMESRAREIAEDMRDEPRERLLTIQSQLSSVQSKDFWEIIDRGRNFEYMPPEQRACLERFFEWLDIEAETRSA